MATIEVWVTRIDKPIAAEDYKKWLLELPTGMQAQNEKFMLEQDRLRHLFARILLKKACVAHGMQENVLETLKRTKFSRPYIDAPIDFNISHAGNLVLCAISNTSRVGIDVELITQVNFEDFEDVMSEGQWKEILASAHPAQAFFRYWTRKESVIKADGRGMHIPLSEISFHGNSCLLGNQKWFLQSLTIDPLHTISLATNMPNVVVSVNEVIL